MWTRFVEIICYFLSNLELYASWQIRLFLKNKASLRIICISYYNITKVKLALWLFSKPRPFTRGCTQRKWASAVKLSQIQQISFPVSKMHRWNVQMESGSWRKHSVVNLKEKSQRIKRQVCPGWINHWLFSSRLGSAEGQPS